MPEDSSVLVSGIMGVLDWIVFAGVLLLTFAVVVIGNFRHRRLHASTEEESFLDLLLMGRRLTLPLFTATLVATWYGGIIPVTEYYHGNGLYGWLTQGGFWYAAYLVFAFALVARVRKTGALTMPDFLQKQFGGTAKTWGALMNLLNVLPIVYLVSLGIFLQLVFGGHLALWMILGLMVVFGYSVMGGFRSVVLSDVVQFSVMCSSVVLVIVFSMFHYGGIGWLMDSPHIPKSHWKPFGEDIAFTDTLVWGLIAFGTLVDPNFYHRCLAAKDTRTARRGILLATLIWVAFDFCTMFGTLYARAVFPEVAAKEAYLHYGVHVLPTGLKGFFLAGFLATILSTLDSYLFMSGTLVSFDLAPRRLRGKVALHHLGTLLVGTLAMILALFVADMELVDVWKAIGGALSACLLFPLLMGILLRDNITEGVFMTSSLTGAGFLILWLLLNPYIPSPINELDAFYPGLLGSCIGWIVARSPKPASTQE